MAVYACTDFHGYYGLLIEIMAYLKPGDEVYFLGDANDRGPHGWRLMKDIYNHPQFHYLKGNHEDMFVDAAYSWMSSGLTDMQVYKFNTHAYRMIRNNGGVKTFDDWRKEGAPVDWVEKIRDLPLYAVYENVNGIKIFLSHAGCTLWRKDGIEDGTITLFDDLLWSREHIHDEWDDQCPADYVVVHGHTPVPHLVERLGYWEPQKIAPYWYADKHKCCLDQLTVSTGCACLLNLDTFEHKVFKDPSFDNER